MTEKQTDQFRTPIIDPGDLSNIPEFTPESETFLEGPYLDQPYIVAPDAESALMTSVGHLSESVPGFDCVVNVGGTANGSLMLRRLVKSNAATDLDIYFIGRNDMINDLSNASDIVSREAQRVKLTLDGELNGKRASNFLNLDNLDDHIAQEDFNLLVLPFQSAFGNVVAAQRAVLEHIIARPDKQQIWDEMAFYHAQSLSLHHGSWSPAFSDLIMQRYYPEKVRQFELPDTPEEILAVLSG